MAASRVHIIALLTLAMPTEVLLRLYFEMPISVAGVFLCEKAL